MNKTSEAENIIPEDDQKSGDLAGTASDSPNKANGASKLEAESSKLEAESSKAKLLELDGEGTFEEYESIRLGMNGVDGSAWEMSSPEKSSGESKEATDTDKTKSGKEKTVSADGEADNAKETKSAESPEKGETSDDEGASGSDDKDQKTRGEHNPRWVNRRVNKAVKNAINPLTEKILDLESKLSALSKGDSNREEQEQSSSDYGEEPDVDDYDDNPEQYVEDLTAWEKKVEASQSKVDKQEGLDEGQKTDPKSQPNEDRATEMQGTVSDIDQILDEKSPDIRDDFWDKVREQKIAFPDSFLDLINDIADSGKISNLLQHFYHDPMKSRSIARMAGDYEKQQSMFAELAETPFIPPVNENKGKSAKNKAVNPPPNIDPINEGKSDQDFDINDEDLPYEQYERARTKQVLDEAYGGY